MIKNEFAFFNVWILLIYVDSVYDKIYKC